MEPFSASILGSGLATASLQAMHGLSFAAVHLGTVGWLSRYAKRRAGRQGVAASAIGAGLAIGAATAGPLYEHLGVRGYFVMGLVSAAGLGFLVAARRVEAGYPQSSGVGG